MVIHVVKNGIKHVMFVKKIMYVTTNSVEKEKQLDLLVYLHDAKSFEMSHYFQNSIREIVILTDGNTEEF